MLNNGAAAVVQHVTQTSVTGIDWSTPFLSFSPVAEISLLSVVSTWLPPDGIR